MGRRPGLTGALITALLAAGLIGGPGEARAGEAAAAGGPVRLVAGWAGVADAEAAAAIASVGERHGGSLILVNEDLDYAAVEVPAPEADRALASLRRLPGVDRAAPDQPLELHLTPNDPFYFAQWGPEVIGMHAAWDEGLGSHGRTVAIIDTGVKSDHADLAPNYCRHGPDYIQWDGVPQDDHGHGTHVAGTVAAALNNGVGVAGMGNSCLVAIRPIDGFGNGSTLYLAEGIKWAADNGVHVVNMSLGSPSGHFSVEDAVDDAWSKGVLLVASAGNDYCSAVGYPAAYPKVVAVGALASSTARSDFSSCGPEVELAAPGSSIYSTEYTGAYGYKSGTSMASPHVAGVAALVWDQDHSLTNAQVRCLLQDTADDIAPAGKDVYHGWGRIDADGALDRLNTGAPIPSWPTCGGTPPPNPPRSEEDVYISGNDLVAQCTLNLGGACFSVREGDTTVRITVDDIFVSPVAGTYSFRDPNGTTVLVDSFCDNTEVAIPAGAVELIVYAGGASRGLLDCGRVGSTATLGWVRLDFNA